MTEETSMDGGQGQAIEVRQEFRPTTQRALLTREALQVDLEQRSLLKEYVAKLMVKDVDFGTIPGTPKPSLLKPGAEKLVDLLRCTPEFSLVEKVEDFERGHGFFSYIFRVRLLNRESGVVLAEGFGSANSREGRYRWRKANRKCPQCGKEAIIQGKAEFGGGWVCFKKKDGCGAKFRAGDASVEGQASGQTENEDVATLANTILKMAKKRALVDGAIALARCSDMFTQDVEDFVDHAPQEDYAPTPEESRPAPERQAAPKAAPKASAVPVVKFGSLKNKALHELSAEQLGVAMDEGHQLLADDSKKAHHGKISAALSDIEAEQERRQAEAHGEVGSQG